MSDRQPDPLSNRYLFIAGHTDISTLWLGTPELGGTAHQVSSRSDPTNMSRDSQDDSSTDSSKMDGEDIQSGGPMSYDLDEQGSWRRCTAEGATPVL